MRTPQTVPMALAPPWQSGRYYFCPNTTSTTTSALANTSLRAVPFFVPSPVLLSKIGAEVTSAGEAGSKYRLGIYADDGTGRPGSLVVDAGQIAGDSATVQELDISVRVGPGWYWAAGAAQSAPTTPPTMRVTNNASFGVLIASSILFTANQTITGMSMTASGALPAAFTTFSLASTVPRIFVKVA